jgi:hypothetical protein
MKDMENNFQIDNDLGDFADNSSDDDLPPDPNNKGNVIDKVYEDLCQKYPNCEFAIEILVTKHFNGYRTHFFKETYKNKKDYSYQLIIENILNSYLKPYKSLIDLNTTVNTEELNFYKLLKNYYKIKEINEYFFYNYFIELKKLHNSKINKNFKFLIPKNELETLNDLERKITLIKSLKFYQNLSIRDRIQTIFKNIIKDPENQQDYYYMYQYLMNEENPDLARRKLSNYNFYNYLPIICKNYCTNEAKFFLSNLKSAINDHLSKSSCEKCKKIIENFSLVEKQINFLYKLTCIFAHNNNEIMYHPLIYKTHSNYLTKLSEIRRIYNPFDMKLIFVPIFPQTTLPNGFSQLLYLLELCKLFYIKLIRLKIICIVFVLYLMYLIFFQFHFYLFWIYHNILILNIF